MINFLALLIGAYLLGSIPTAYWVFKRLTKGKDIRNYGSHNAGATNLRRALKDLGIANYNKWFVFNIFVDAIKAALPLLIIIFYWGYNSWMIGPVGFIAVIGHIFPLFIPAPRFKGGKGAATAIIGVYLPLVIFYVINHPQPLVIGLAVSLPFFWGFVYALKRQMSSANLLLIIYITTIFFGGSTAVTNEFSIVLLWIFVGFIAAVTVVTHLDNWGRIFRGKELPV